MKAKRIIRVFNYNGVQVPDPNPDMSLDAVARSLSSVYPELTNAKVEEGETVSSDKGHVQTFNIKVAAGKKG